MIYVTTATKYKICPQWEVKVPVTAKYRFTDNPDNPYEAAFLFATCAILQNLKLPPDKRNDKYAPFTFCGLDRCSHLQDFDKVIDSRS